MTVPASEIEEWKSYYEDMGLPSGLLNEMIDEANEEWNSTLNLSNIERFADLTINVNDLENTPDCFYIYGIIYNENIIRSINSTVPLMIFSDLECRELQIVIIKMRLSDNAIKGAGYSVFAHSKDEEITITVQSFEGEYLIGALLNHTDLLTYSFPTTEPDKALPEVALDLEVLDTEEIKGAQIFLSYTITPARVIDIDQTASIVLAGEVLDVDIENPNASIGLEANADAAVTDPIGFIYLALEVVSNPVARGNTPIKLSYDVR